MRSKHNVIKNANLSKIAAFEISRIRLEVYEQNKDN